MVFKSTSENTILLMNLSERSFSLFVDLFSWRGEDVWDRPGLRHQVDPDLLKSGSGSGSRVGQAVFRGQVGVNGHHRCLQVACKQFALTGENQTRKLKKNIFWFFYSFCSIKIQTFAAWSHVVIFFWKYLMNNVNIFEKKFLLILWGKQIFFGPS